jgi:thiamine-phosphate pyrophosphorylase
MGTSALFDLLLITDEAPELPQRVARALESAPAGRVAVQLRHKGASAQALYDAGLALRGITRKASAPLIINDRADVALALDADGVHLPEAGLSTALARSLMGAQRLVGRSCHDAAGLARAEREGADYVTLAPVLAVPGKGAPLGLEGFARLCASVALPVYALGGISDAHVAPLRAVGARGVAVIRYVLSAEEPGARVHALLRDL